MKALLLRLALVAAAAYFPVCCQAERLLLRGANATAATVLHSSLSSGSANKTATSKTRPPRVYFLFLAVDKISNLDVWGAFFANAPVEQYRAFVHCKLPACNAQTAGSALVSVPTVPSYYCTDLVSPMNQLLAHALASDATMPHPQDKFAFISDSTLPAKPFSSIYATLSARQGSDFCVFPSNEWADVPSASGLEIVVKHHQWITLERGHAEKLSADWAAGKLHNLMPHFHMNANAYTWSNNSFADNRNWGCLDEFWHMAALYGTLNNIDVTREHNMPLLGFVGGPLKIASAAGWQGACDTFVVWSKYLHALGNNPFERLHSQLDHLSIPHGGNHARPGWWDTISTHGMRAIRSSEFLFVRKFIDQPRLADGGSFSQMYAQLVLAA